jgi:hypothetical protein
MLRKWFLLLTFSALSVLLLTACDTTNPPQAALPANTPNAVALPALQTGRQTTLVYFLTIYKSSSDFTGVLRRYNPMTRKSVDVLNVHNVKIEEAQISADGQWILYVAYVIDHDELRLVRVDGRYAQTLLSAPLYAGISNAQWSPDQKQIAFAEQPPQTGPRVIYLLTLAQRHIQPELLALSQPGAPQYVPRKWLDTTRLLVTDVISNSRGADFQRIALLDTRKGANQQPGDLQALSSASGQCGDFDTSADGTQLFMLSCSAGILAGGSSTISVQALSGGAPRTIFHSSTLLVEQIRQFTPQVLLLISSRAIWSIHSDGTGLKQLFSAGDQYGRANFCQFSRSSWSNFARDGSLLALEGTEMGTDTHSSALEIGSPSGGSLQTVARGLVGVARQGSDIFLVGWATL